MSRLTESVYKHGAVLHKKVFSFRNFVSDIASREEVKDQKTIRYFFKLREFAIFFIHILHFLMLDVIFFVA